MKLLKAGGTLKRIILAFGFVSLVFTFQNCQQNPGAQSTSSGGGVETKSVPLISDQSLEAMTYYISPTNSKAVTRAELDSTQRPQAPRELLLNLRNGVVMVQNDSTRYCITDSEKSELQQILKQASLCQSQAAAGQLCNLSYVSPYAVMHFANEDIALGEARSSCEKVDLCDAYPDLIKGFFASIARNLSARVCQ